MPHVLDRPVWSALESRQFGLSTGGTAAKRFLAEVSPFAATSDDAPESYAALGDLLDPKDPDDQIFLMQVPTCLIPECCHISLQAQGVQMLKSRPAVGVSPRTDIAALGLDDRAEMTALAALTKPGPFRARTPEMGQFWGVRIDGRLAAMAGQRLALPGYVEVSGVCTHPDFRGQGLAAALSDYVAAQILAHGDRPFLHAWADNDGAIKLYKRLGFDLRTKLTVTVLTSVQAAE
ncbi:GNAT family N-acetyltransferase [Roseibium limicola]|uniref:GNAT family N-acetyltransferase n=1 Tax=Roseibium limicola TaxID=2816037 RepID=A0A939J7X2_9HYPH|nr:GNAT family N-acetyltransferase [Roseibium limicola]MBO0343748.1 GNAT family N-acetyltransferase [Roseibium limicola]